MLEKLKQVMKALRPATLSEAYSAGEDCGLRGANATNCHPSFFRTARLTKAWEMGKQMGDAKAKLAAVTRN